MSKELIIRITGDQSGLEKATDESIGTLKGFGSKVSALSVAAGNLLADGIKSGFSAVGGFLKDSIGAASDMGETTSKVGVLFGDAAGQITEFAASAATGLGQSRQQAMDAAATFATFGKSAGLTGAPLAKFSTDLVGLSSDLASFSNTTPEDAIAAIGSALRGEAEPMRRYGVLLDDASMRQEALAMGIISSTKDALTPQQKVLAAQSLIFKQTSAAQGDFARTSDGLANQQRILSAQVDNLKTRIGSALLPTVLKITSAITQHVIPVLSAWAERYGPAVEAALGRLSGWISKIAGLFMGGQWQSGLAEVGKKIVTVWADVHVWIYTVAYPAIAKALLAIGKAFGNWITETAVPYLAENLPVWLQTLADWFTGTAWPWISERVGELAETLGGWISKAAATLQANLPTWISEFIAWYYGTALPWLIERVGELAEKLGGWIGEAAEYLARNLPGWLAKLSGWLYDEAIPALVRFGAAAARTMGEVAEAIVDGLIRGLWGLASYLAGRISSWVSDNVTGAIMGALGINSPSRVAMGLGRGVAEGMALGMIDGQSLVADASGQLALAAVPPVGMSGFTPAQLPGSAGGSWSGGAIVVQTYIDGRQVASSLAPHQRELERSKR